MNYKLTLDMLKKVCKPSSTPDESLTEFCSQFNWYAADFGLDNELRAAAFLAQVFSETDYLQSLEENLNYSAERILQVWPRRFNRERAAACAHNPERLANTVYADRLGNGNYYSGDGFRYRGRGCLMLTGYHNYFQFLEFVKEEYGMNLLPEDVSRYPAAMLSAMWFWKEHRLNTFADIGDIDSITRDITGSLADAENRKRRYIRVRLGVSGEGLEN